MIPAPLPPFDEMLWKLIPAGAIVVFETFSAVPVVVNNRVDAGNRNRAAVGQDDAPATGIVNYDIAHRSRADVDCASNRSTVSIAERQTTELHCLSRG